MKYCNLLKLYSVSVGIERTTIKLSFPEFITTTSLYKTSVGIFIWFKSSCAEGFCCPATLLKRNSGTGVFSLRILRFLLRHALLQNTCKRLPQQFCRKLERTFLVNTKRVNSKYHCIKKTLQISFRPFMHFKQFFTAFSSDATRKLVCFGKSDVEI